MILMGFKQTALEDRDCLQPEQRKTENLPPGAVGKQADCTVRTLTLWFRKLRDPPLDQN